MSKPAEKPEVVQLPAETPIAVPLNTRRAAAQRVREAVEEIRLRIQVGRRELSAGQLLERLGFSAERQWTPVGDLSGGERRRLQMLRLLMDEPNVLLLDEPTNDLDIDTLTEFEDLLDDWPGTLVTVSHDRYFLERVTDHVMALPGDGSLRLLPGGVDEFIAEVMGLLEAQPDATEVQVERVKFLRYGEARGDYDQVVATLNASDPHGK